VNVVTLHLCLSKQLSVNGRMDGRPVGECNSNDDKP